MQAIIERERLPAIKFINRDNLSRGVKDINKVVYSIQITTLFEINQLIHLHCNNNFH